MFLCKKEGFRPTKLKKSKNCRPDMNKRFVLKANGSTKTKKTRILQANYEPLIHGWPTGM